MLLPAATQDKGRAGAQRGQAPGSPSSSPGAAARTAPRTSSQPREEPQMSPELFFFSGLCEVTAALPEPRARRGVRLDLAALCAAPHGRAAAGHGSPSDPCRAAPRPVRKRGKGRRLRRHDSVCGSPIPSRAPRPWSLPVGEEEAQQSPQPMPAVPGRAPPAGSGRAALTQADGSERRQRALTELRGRCLLHGGSLSPALQRGGNRSGSAPAKPLR